MVDTRLIAGWYESLEEARDDLLNRGELGLIAMSNRRAIFSQDKEKQAWTVIRYGDGSFLDSNHYTGQEEMLLALTRWVYQGLWK